VDELVQEEHQVLAFGLEACHVEHREEHTLKRERKR
jgi:hypothetical protein